MEYFNKTFTDAIPYKPYNTAIIKNVVHGMNGFLLLISPMPEEM